LKNHRHWKLWSKNRNRANHHQTCRNRNRWNRSVAKRIGNHHTFTGTGENTANSNKNCRETTTNSDQKKRRPAQTRNYRLRSEQRVIKVKLKSND
jgi:hypothetical protein